MDPRPLHVFSDFDGTISEPDTIMFLVERVGGGPELYCETGELLHQGRLTLREGVARDMRSIRVPFVEAARLLRTGVRVDPGFPALARWCATQGIPLTILSAGFEEIIRLFVPPAEYPEIEVLANRFRPGTWESVFRDDSHHGHDKAAALRAAAQAGARTVFIGDGFSDFDPAAVADLVFARRGRSLVAHCRKHDIACVEYSTFHDVLTRLEALRRQAA